MQVYEVPNLHLEGKMCRTNLMPRSIVRGPGFLNAVMIMEQVRPSVSNLHLTCMQPGFLNAVMIMEQVRPSASNLHLTYM